MGRMIVAGSDDSLRGLWKRLASWHRGRPRLPWWAALAGLALVAAALITLVPGQLASAGHGPTSGVIDFARLDADTDTGGIQICATATSGTPFSFDLVIDEIHPDDTGNFASLGQVGIRFTTGDFTSPNIDFVPGVLDDTGGSLGSGGQGSDVGILVTDTTLVAKDYFNFTTTNTSPLIGEVIIARITLTPAVNNAVLPVDVTSISNSSWDSYMGGAFGPIVLPTAVEGIDVAVGTAMCPGENTAPVADDNSATTDEGTASAPITLSANDADGDCPLTFSIVSGPSNGSLSSIIADTCSAGSDSATVTYTPTGDFFGSDSFTYTAKDPSDAVSDPATVSITVNPVNDAPNANPNTVSTLEDTEKSITLTGDPGDGALESSQALTFILASLPSAGILSETSGGAAIQPGDLPLTLADATIYFNPALNSVASQTFDFRVQDDGGTANGGVDTSTDATITVNITPENDPPVCSGASGIGVTEFTTSAPFSLNCSDVDGDSLACSIVTAGSIGNISITSCASTTYTSTGGTGPDTVVYKANDGALDSANAEVSVTISPPANPAPSCLNGTVATAEDTTSPPFNLRCTDTNFDGFNCPIEFSIVTSSGPSNGSLNVDLLSVACADPLNLVSLTYTPDTNFCGSDSFQFQGDDGTTLSNIATINITVTCVNDAPDVTAPTSISLPEDGANTEATTITDVDDTVFTCAVKTGFEPDHGSVTFGINCADITYTATDADFNGSDAFTFTVTDSGGGQGSGFKLSDDQAVSVTITAVNDEPVADDNSASTDEDIASAPITLSATDVDGDCPLNLSIVSGPSNGTLGDITGETCSAGNASATVTYTPTGDFFGSDSFTYKANDGSVDSNTATVNITVNPINDPPDVTAPTSITLPEDGADTEPTTITDVDGNTFTCIVKSGSAPDHGSVTFGINCSSVTYTATDADFNGSDAFTFTVTDDGGGQGSSFKLSDDQAVSVTITPDNDAPIADDNSATTDEGTTSAPITLSATDVEGDCPLNLSIVSGPSNGTLGDITGETCSAGNASATVTYTPTGDFFGSDSFTYKANDGSVDSNTATVVITVNPINDAPDVTAPTAITVPEDGSNSAATTISDPDDTTFTCIVKSGSEPVHGGVTFGANCSSVTYTATDVDFNGSDAFTFTVTDSGGGQGSGFKLSDDQAVSVTISAVNDPPVCQNVSLTTDEDIQGSTEPDCSDAEGDTLTFAIVDQPTDGAASVGSLLYDPDSNFFGNDSFTYKANDGTADSNTATVNVTVQNDFADAPVAGEQSITTTQGQDLEITLTGDDPDGCEDQSYSFEIVDGPSDGSVDPTSGPATCGSLTATVTYTPDTDFIGTDSFTFRFSDGTERSSDLATVTIVVAAVLEDVNGPPDAVDDSATVNQNSTDNVIKVLDNDSDPDGDTLTITSVSDPANGTATTNGSTVTYTPDAGFSGTDTFTYTISDGQGGTDTATVTVTVPKALGVTSLPVSGGPGPQALGLPRMWAVIDVLVIIVASAFLVTLAIWHQWALRTQRFRRR